VAKKSESEDEGGERKKVEIAEDVKTETSGSSKSINPARVEFAPSQKIKPIPKARSLFLFTHDNRFRKACHFISNHRWFGNSLLVCILVSSIMLAAEDPVNYKSKTNDVSFPFASNLCILIIKSLFRIISRS
jgi:voltage-dependent calcium channel L type alpha-1D